MKLSLNLEFSSVAEMQDWIVKEAEQLASNNAAVAIEAVDAVDRKITVQDIENVKDVLIAPEPKPKRKRRTKAEMAAARAAEAQAAAASEPEPVTEVGVELGTEPEPPAEVEAATPAGGNGAGDLQKRFTTLMAKDPHAAVAELDRVVGPQGRFSECPVEVQREILAVLEGRQ